MTKEKYQIIKIEKDVEIESLYNTGGPLSFEHAKRMLGILNRNCNDCCYEYRIEKLRIRNDRFVF